MTPFLNIILQERQLFDLPLYQGWDRSTIKNTGNFRSFMVRLGISASIFVYNLKWYRRTRFAYTTLVTGDTANYDNVHPDLVVFVERGDAPALQSYRNEFRRNIDYSAVFFIVLWGLNVVDAAVDAHLKSFDISPDLSFKVKFGQSPLAGTNGVSLVLAFK